MTSESLGETRALIRRVFSYDAVLVSAWFVAFDRGEDLLARAVRRLAGIKEFLGLWVVLDDDGSVVGTTGLYRKHSDANEAVWLSWFCVAPEHRGRGVGGRLLDFSIERARRTGARHLRLFTSNIPAEACAQGLYESRGLVAYKSRGLGAGYRIIWRQLSLG
ncbi:MAG TPA: GNAT family N-acetyltransferase [Coriobacteriia bacterium]|nr:GNAT family N-acetyltransferase [Coriobacteriia bacterium]